nr:outer membrane protein assembly factor BamA [Aristophania vespae]
MPGGIIQSILVKGNSRIETGTVLSYMVVQPGDSFNKNGLNRSLKTLYATGLFRDITIERQGSTLVVNLVENPVVDKIVFEGNHSLKDNDILKEVDLKPRAVFSSQTVASDRQKILNLYAKHARYGATVTPQIIRLSNNRVDVVFRINEARQTLVKKIAFVGNKSFSESALSSVISSKETAWYRFFSSADEYNPERMRYDAELLRRYYLHNGFVDFKLIDATGELSPDHKTFYITFTIKEGPRYRLGKIDVRSDVHGVTKKMLKKHIELFKNQYYDGTAIQNNANDMQEWLQESGHPFALVRTEIARNPEKKIVNLLYDVVQGPRVYVERIDINGNTVTRDPVIRRNLPMAEGDAYTPYDRKYAKLGLKDLGYFKTVTIDQTQGSAPDKANLAVNVTEKPTGEFSLGGGYSTDVGVLGNLGLKQHNLLGTGLDAGFSGTVAYYEKQADLSITDPNFLGRNFVAGADIYYMQNNYQTYQSYNEDQYGLSLRLGYAFNRYLSQSWTYSLVNRKVGNAMPGRRYCSYDPQGCLDDTPSIYVQDAAGWSLLSQLSTTVTYDRRDNRVNPRSGYVLRATGDFAGLGGNTKYLRGKFSAAYYIPLDSITASHDWTIQLKSGVGYMGDWSSSGHRSIIDNFYLGGDSLRGFLQGGVGPRSGHYRGSGANCSNGWCPGAGQEDLLGGRFMYTASAQLNFPFPFGDKLGMSGRGFIDAGSLTGVRVKRLHTSASQDGKDYTPITGNTYTPRVAGGLGLSWRSPFGLVNIDGAVPIHKERGDRLYPIRFGFGQQF